MGRRSICGRNRSGARFHSFPSLKTTHDHSDDANQQTPSRWSWLFTNDKYDCKLLYTMYKECVHLFLDNGEDADDGLCSGYRQQFEGSCGKYKSLCSSWWTENDEKRLCKKWSKFYEECDSFESLEICKGAWSLVKNACRGVKLD